MLFALRVTGGRASRRRVGAWGARGVEVDAERVLLDPLGYREGKDSERDVWSGLAAPESGCEGGPGRAVWNSPLLQTTGTDSPC